MEITHKNGEKKGIFLATSENRTIGEMTYQMETPATMSIEHTEVKASERGNDIGMQLLDSAAAYAREMNLRIKPVCKFVQVMFRKHAAKYNDVNINSDL